MQPCHSLYYSRTDQMSLEGSKVVDPFSGPPMGIMAKMDLICLAPFLLDKVQKKLYLTQQREITYLPTIPHYWDFFSSLSFSLVHKLSQSNITQSISCFGENLMKNKQ